jgi:hypothetical protein
LPGGDWGRLFILSSWYHPVHFSNLSFVIDLFSPRKSGTKCGALLLSHLWFILFFFCFARVDTMTFALPVRSH